MPRVGRSISEGIWKLAQDGIASSREHFRVGSKSLYFPTARVVLLRPNAKHTPYQAKFIVPKSFNKLDLRDYLFHVYGLRALNVTTQLQHARYERDTPFAGRFRGPQIKKMTIDMESPFVWPAEPEGGAAGDALYDPDLAEHSQRYAEAAHSQLGSGEPPARTQPFGGALGPQYRPPAQPFVPRRLHRSLKRQLQRHKAD